MVAIESAKHTAVVYQRSRFYNPEQGRFLTFDTFNASAHDPLQLHKYAYAGNNPVMNIDPSGESFTLTGAISVGAIAGGIAGLVGGYTFGVYQTGSYFSPENVKYALVGTVLGAGLGAIVGGGAYIIAGGGGIGGGGLSTLGSVLRTGFSQLWLKALGAHSTTANAAIAGFAIGLVAGIIDPSHIVSLSSAVATASLIVNDALVRGAVWKKETLTTLGIASLYELQKVLFVYGQSTTLITVGFATGFTIGYPTGSVIRTSLLDEFGITPPSNGI